MNENQFMRALALLICTVSWACGSVARTIRDGSQTPAEQISYSLLESVATRFRSDAFICLSDENRIVGEEVLRELNRANLAVMRHPDCGKSRILNDSNSQFVGVSISEIQIKDTAATASVSIDLGWSGTVYAISLSREDLAGWRVTAWEARRSWED